MTRLLPSEGMVGSLHTSWSWLAPSGRRLKVMSSPRSITCTNVLGQMVCWLPQAGGAGEFT
jgi:hypothetical protein